MHLNFLNTTPLSLLTAITMSTKRQFDYKIGDRVAERPKLHGVFARQETMPKIQQYRSQRYGTVVGLNIKVNKTGNKRKYLLIQWDYLKSPMEHDQSRICPVAELDHLTKQTIVPGE